MMEVSDSLLEMEAGSRHQTRGLDYPPGPKAFVPFSAVCYPGVVVNMLRWPRPHEIPGTTMPPRIYTRTGDQGETGLFHGPRVGKDMPRIEVMGALDELNAILGLARSRSLPDEIDTILNRVQNELFVLGAEVSTPDPSHLGMQRIGRQHVEALESDIDRLGDALPPLTVFILPGGTLSAADMHLARAVCRRAERRMVTLLREVPEDIALVLLAYLNRLADLLFVIARTVNLAANCPDVPWQKPS